MPPQGVRFCYVMRALLEPAGICSRAATASDQNLVKQT